MEEISWDDDFSESEENYEMSEDDNYEMSEDDNLQLEIEIKNKNHKTIIK